MSRPLPAALREIRGVVAASRLERPAVPMASCGIPEVDALTGGLPRGALTEICGAASSGRTSLMMAAIAAATIREEMCALIDVGDCFDPKSADAAGVDLDRVLWVRCGNRGSTQLQTDKEEQSNDLSVVTLALEAIQRSGAIMPPAKVWYGRSPARSERDGHGSTRIYTDQNKEQKIQAPFRERLGTPRLERERDTQRVWRNAIEQGVKAADLVLQSGGFGLVVLDMADVPVETARRIPLTSWFRFSRAVENTPTMLLTVGLEAYAKSSAAMVLRTTVSNQESAVSETPAPSHAHVFRGIESIVEVMRSRVEAPNEGRGGKKPPRGVRAEFSSRTEWAG